MFEEKLDFLIADPVPSKQHEILEGALELLSKVPSVQDRTLEILSDYVKFAYKSLEAASDEEWERDVVLKRLESSVAQLSELIDCNPDLWSLTVVKWMLALLKALSEERGSTSSSVDADVKHWITHPATKSICSLLTSCLDMLLSTDASLATTFILDQVLGQNHLYEWIFAYIMSLHPKKLVPCLLQMVFSGKVESTGAVYQMLEFAAHSSRAVVEDSLGDLVKVLLKSKEDSEILSALSFFHSLILQSHPLVHLVLPLFLNYCTPCMLYELTYRIWDTLDFPYNMMSSIVSAIFSLPDDLLMEVLNLLLLSQAFWEPPKTDDENEDNMEEGELPDVEESAKELSINPIIDLLNRLVQHLYEAHMSMTFGPKHSRHGNSVEFLIKLQNKASTLVDWYLCDAKEPRSSWLHLTLVVVCQSAPANTAGKIIAHTLCSCHRDVKFAKMVGLVSEVQVVCPDLLNFVVSYIVSREQSLSADLDQLQLLIQYSEQHSKRLIPVLNAAIQHNTAALVQCLQGNTSTRRVLGLLGMVSPSLLPYFEQIGLAGVLLKVYFVTSIENTRQVAQGIDPSWEKETVISLILPIISNLLTTCTHLTSYVCQCVLKTIVQPEMGGYLTQSPLPSSPIRVIQRGRSSSSLFSQHQAGSAVKKVQQKEEGKNPHSGTLGSRRIRALSLSSRGFANTGTQNLAISYCHEQVLALVYECCRGNPSACGHFVEEILAQVAPTYPQGKSALDVSEELQKVTVEWNLAIKKTMEDHPAFWHILHVITEENPSSLLPFRSVVVSMCSLLGNHWAQNRLGRAADCPKELDASCHIVELCRKALWLPRPLSRVDQLIELVSPYEAHLLLKAVLDCVENSANGLEDQDLEGSQSKFESTLKSVLRNNAKELGPLFSVFYPSKQPKVTQC